MGEQEEDMRINDFFVLVGRHNLLLVCFIYIHMLSEFSLEIQFHEGLFAEDVSSNDSDQHLNQDLNLSTQFFSNDLCKAKFWLTFRPPT